jgi:dienelactone hydrolase
MAEILMFHHILGFTPGMAGFAEDLRRAGHTVHAPDLFEGRTFATIKEGAAFANGDESPDFTSLADEAAGELPPDIVYLGFSFGVTQAQRLAQTREGAAGAVLIDACLPVSGEWAIGPWPAGVPVQIHGMDGDEFFAGDGDIDAAREIVAAVGSSAELYVYPGDGHLFADRSLPSYDADAADLLVRRTLDLLDRVTP